MCDNNKNNKNVYQQQQIWALRPLLQLLLVVLLIQQQLVNATPPAAAAANANAAVFHPGNIQHGKDAVNLPFTRFLVQQQEQQNDGTFKTDDVVDLSLSTARKLLAVDSDNDSDSKMEGSNSAAVVGALTDMEDDIVDNADVDKSENVEDMDRIEFSGYLNDFNMQHEASIPEDILDQRHIEDEQQNAEGVVEEDIILESQRSTIKNFTSHNNNNNNNNNENHGNNNKNYNSDDDNGSNNNSTSSSSNNYKRKKKKTNNNSYQHKKLKNNKIDQHHHFEISVAIENDEQQNADDDSGSFKNEKLKNRQQQQQQQQLKVTEQQKQLDDIVDLNEQKFNKLTVAENFNNDESYDEEDDATDDEVDFKWNSNNKEEQQQQQHKYDEKQKNEQQKAIGDIEDNSFRNEAAWETEIANDNDASAGIAVVAAASDDDINDNDDDDISDATTVPTTTTTTAKTIIFVGRKTKRHGTVLSTQNQHQQQQQEQIIDVADQQYDDEQQQILYDMQEHSRHHRYNGDRSNSNNNNNNKNNVGNNMPTLQDDLEQKEQKQKLLVKPDYSISYFGISTSNGSGINAQKDMRVEATNVKSFSMSDSSSSGRSSSNGQDMLKVTNEDGVTLSQHSDYVTPTLTAFEQHKAQRRNNRRTGHKSHKKKYKDYLRYVLATETTTTTTTEKPTTIQEPAMVKIVKPEIATKPTATAIEEKDMNQQQWQQQQQKKHQQRLVKLKQYKDDIKSMEKSRQLPAAAPAPIFVLTNHRGEDAAITDVLAKGAAGGSEMTTRPYYEGQLSYYMETRDDEDDMKNMPGTNVGKLITSETGSNNWYRRIQPILRNGMTKQQHHHHHHQQHHQHEPHHQHHHHQHHHHNHGQQHEHRKHLHEEQQPRQQHQSDSSDLDGSTNPQKVSNRDQLTRHHAYQRRLPTNKKEQKQPHRPRYIPPAPLETPPAPLPPPGYRGATKQQKPTSDGALQELGHQITQMDEFDRYYRKWPHLARVQYQINNENYRATHGGGGGLLDGADSETEYDYQLAGDELEDEFANEDDDEDDDDENEDAEDANLPPYIKKYNRRNKQLLNLLEGTLPPPTPPKRIIWSSSILQPGPRDAAPVVRVDDDYIKEKRRRYQKQHNGNAKQLSASKDLFAEQRDASDRLGATSIDDGSTATTTKTTMTTTNSWQAQEEQQQQHPSNLNHIPDDDVDVSSSQEFDDWEKEIAASVKGSEKMRWQIEKSAATTTGAAPIATATTTTTLKPAVFRLPSYPGYAGSFIGKPRSRSSQFAPSSGSSIISSGSSSGRLLPGISGNRAGNSFISNALHSGNYKSAMDARDDGDSSSFSSNHNENIAPPTVPPSSTVTVAAKPLSNSFVYHRVEVAPRVVGAGFTGHKQRLPFVAITDRRLETSKKSLALLERQRNDFEQNHYPMP